MKKMMGFVLACVLVIAFSAQAAVRDTPERTGDLVAVGVASNTVIYRGTMVAVSATGYALPAADTAGLKVLGRAEATVDNSGTAGDGKQTLVVRRGVFRWTNGDTYTVADIGTLAYVEDSATVQKAASASHNVVAGLIIAVDADGVWVDTSTLGSQGAVEVTTLAATSDITGGRDLALTRNATVGGTLGVTGVTTLTGAALVNDVDARTATTLLLGKATATKVEIADTGVETEIQGTLDVQEAAAFASTVAVTGVATFTAAPKLTATTAAGAETVTMTNAPAAGDPVWMDIAVGTNTYVIALFPAE